MKNTYLLLLFSGLILMIGCSQEGIQNEIQENITTENSDRRFDPDAENCYTPVDLIAGQNYISGIVSYQILNNELVVTYDTSGTDWQIEATHLYVGDCDEIPTNNPGNPRIGQFPYKSVEASGTNIVEWAIPISDFPVCGCIAAHAEVSLLDPETGNTIQSETAWADGDPLPGNSWAMFFDYCVSDCL